MSYQIASSGVQAIPIGGYGVSSVYSRRHSFLTKAMCFYAFQCFNIHNITFENTEKSSRHWMFSLCLPKKVGLAKYDQRLFYKDALFQISILITNMYIKMFSLMGLISQHISVSRIVSSICAYRLEHRLFFLN